MKNNIILIIVVTIISIAVIIISVAVSAGNRKSDESSVETSSNSTTASTTTSATTPEETEPPEPITVPAPPEPTDEPDEPERIHDAQTAGNVVALARSLIGTDFVDGGESPSSGFDNSGFIYYVLRENGYITCPRGVSAQSMMGAELSFSELKTGDLVFFSESGATAEFGGIYVGDGVMVACLMPGTQVKEVDITSSYYQSHFFRGVGIN